MLQFRVESSDRGCGRYTVDVQCTLFIIIIIIIIIMMMMMMITIVSICRLYEPRPRWKL